MKFIVKVSNFRHFLKNYRRWPPMSHDYHCMKKLNAIKRYITLLFLVKMLIINVICFKLILIKGCFPTVKKV